MKPLLRLAALALALGLAACARSGEDRQQLLEAAARRVEAGTAVLIDVREPGECATTGMARPAVNLPLSDLRGDRRVWKPFLESNSSKELVLYCRSGFRSGQAAKMLAEEGYTTTNAGSFPAWQRAGLPTRTAP